MRNLERQHRRKDGSLFPVEVHSNLLEYEGQQYAIAFVQDITERKRMEEVLEKRILALTQPLEDVEGITFDDLFNLSDIQHLQDLYAEAFGVAALITHPDGTPITKPSNFTHLCENIIRKTRKGAENCKHSDAIIGSQKQNGPNIRPCLSSGLCDSGANISVGGHHIANWLIGQVKNEFLNEEKIVAYAREIGVDEDEFRKAYHQVPFMSMEQFERVAQVVYTVAKQLSMMAYQNVQQARFISERKAAEAELRRLRNYLSNIIDSMPSVLVGVDHKGRVTQWNKQAERATGLLSDQVAAKPLNTVFPQLMDQKDRIKTAIRERRVISLSKVLRKMERESRYEDITIFPLVGSGVEGAVIRVDDVTGQVWMEEMMIQSEKMMSVGGLAAGMAHEVNNPLAGILQNAAVLENRLMGDLPANRKAAEAVGITLSAIRQYLERRKLPGMIENIRASGIRAATIVGNMLSFARKSDQRVSSHDLGSLLDQTLELVRTDYDMKKRYDVKQIRIEREYDPVAPPVPCEAGKVQQVFMNILKNGAEAMAEVTDAPAPPAFVLRVQNAGDWVRVEIEDNGPGMDEKTRRRIFEPFFTTKPVGRGTGLGLSVSYFIITDDHGGQMHVRAAEGGGTCFVIRLPKEGRRSGSGEPETG
jgi:PAS domain S-box-containing protein